MPHQGKSAKASTEGAAFVLDQTEAAPGSVAGEAVTGKAAPAMPEVEMGIMSKDEQKMEQAITDGQTRPEIAPVHRSPRAPSGSIAQLDNTGNGAEGFRYATATEV